MTKIRSIAEKHNTDVNLLLILVKTITKKYLYESKNGEHVDYGKNVTGTYEDVMLSISHRDEYENTEWMKAVKGAISDLIKHYPSDYKLDIDSIISLCCTINTNIYLMEDGEQAVGIGLYTHMLLMNHSCIPNTTFSVLPNSPMMYTRAMREIKEGEEVTLSYIDLYQPRSQRIDMLQRTKYFTCQCERCTENMEGSIDALIEGWFCTDLNCRGVLIFKTIPSEVMISKEKRAWVCQSCSKEVSNRDIVACIDHSERLLNTSNMYYRANIWDKAKQFLIELLDEYANPKNEFRMLPENAILFNTRLKLMNCSTRMGDILGALINCQYVVKCFERVHPYDFEISNYYCHIGDILFKAAKDPKTAPIARAQSKLLRTSLDKAYQIRKDYLGESHPLTKTILKMLEAVS